MKILMFKTDYKTHDPERRNRLNFEQVLIALFTAVFILMIIIQAAVTNSTIRAWLSINDDLEGTPLVEEVYLYDRGEIVLELLQGGENRNLWVLINGDEAYHFLNNTISINVKDGDVVELDGSRLDEQLEVVVLSKSDNIINECVDKKIKVHSNIKEITRIKLK